MRIIDNIIALRIVYLLTVPIEKTDAFKLGLIDSSGSTIKKAESDEEKSATSMLHRLVWNIKKVFNVVPGGKTRLGSLAAAYLLVRESYDMRHSEVQALQHFNENFDRVWNMPFEDCDLIIDALSVLDEDAAANSSGSAVSTDTPTFKKKVGRKFAEFEVDDDTFSKFKNGKAKFRKWSNYLNLEDTHHKTIYDFATRNPRGIIVLKDQKGALRGIRYSRRGSGNWANIGRKKLTESTIINYDYELIDDIQL